MKLCLLIRHTESGESGLLIEEDTEKLLIVVTYTTHYLFSGMQQKTAPHRSKRQHRKLISMRFRLRQRVRRLGETEQMGVRLREASRHSQLNKALHIPSPPPLPPPQDSASVCVCASVCVWRASVCVCVSVRPYILNHVTWHEQSCSQCDKHRYI